MSGYSFRAMRVCVVCGREFSAVIALAVNAAQHVWWRCEPKHCLECMKGEQ